MPVFCFDAIDKGTGTVNKSYRYNIAEIPKEVVILATSDEKKHDLLLIIVTALFIRFSIGLGAEEGGPPPVVIPPAR